MGFIGRSSDPAVQRASAMSLATLRAGQILDWSSVDKAALVVLSPAPLLLIALVRVHVRVADASIDPILDRAFLAWVERAVAAALLAQAVFVPLWLRFRARRPESLGLVVASLGVFAALLAFGAFLVGPVSTPILGALIAAVCAVLLLFESRVAVPLAVFAIVAYFAPLLLVALGVCSYAPVFRTGPFESSTVATEWIAATTTFAVGITVVPAALLAGVVRRWRSRDAALLELARLDPLTHVANRRYFFDRLQIELERARRHESKLAVLLLDLDFFKKVNDQYGHLVGDSVLVHISEVLTHEVLRRIDVVGRYGGEEFAVLLPETDLDGACSVAERCRAAIVSPCPRAGGGTIPVTVSIGVVAPAPGEGSDGVVRRVDAALYEAKSTGRNRVVALR